MYKPKILPDPIHALADEAVVGYGGPGEVANSSPRLDMAIKEVANSATPHGNDNPFSRAYEAPYVTSGTNDLVRAKTIHRKQLPKRGGKWTVQRKGIIPDGKWIMFISDEGEIHISVIPHALNHGIRHAAILIHSKDFPGFSNVRVGDEFAEGTILYVPTAMKNNIYSYGLNLNVASTSAHQVPDDGMFISETLAQTTVRHVRIFELPVNSNDVLVRINGKTIPEVGDVIDPSKPIIGKRTIADDVGGIIALEEWRHDPSDIQITDTVIVSPSAVKGVVKDVRITASSPKFTYSKEIGFQEVLEHVAKSRNAWAELMGAVPDIKADMTTDTNLLLTKARVMCNNTKLLMKDREAPELLIEVEVVWDSPLSTLVKMATVIGGKGMICGVLPDDQMPVDADGVRADIIKGANVAVKRNIPTDDILHTMGALVHRGHRQMLVMLDPSFTTYTRYKEVRKAVKKAPAEILDGILSKYMRLVHLLNPDQEETTADALNKREISPRELIEFILTGGLMITRSTSIATGTRTHRDVLNHPYVDEFAPTVDYINIYDPLTGNTRKSKDKSYIGNLYMFPQLFSADDPSATHSASYYPTGLIAAKKEGAKSTYPIRDKCIIIQGPDEVTHFPLNGSVELVNRYRASTGSLSVVDHQLVNQAKSGKAGDPALVLSEEDMELNALKLVNHMLTDLGQIRLIVPDGTEFTPPIVVKTITPDAVPIID